MESNKFQNKYRIPSARASWHDYNGGAYFITICTAGRNHYFGDIRNGEMELNELGQKLNELIMEIPNHNSYAQIPVFQVMPNHVHLIVYIDVGGDGDGGGRDAACHVSTGTPTTPTKQTDTATAGNKKMRGIAERCGRLSTTIGGLKSAITKYANTHQIEFAWQTRFHDHIIRDQNEMNRIATYIEQNPSNWNADKFYTD